MTSSASRAVPIAGAKPPSSPTPVASPFFFRIDLSAWNVSAPARSASRNDGKPAGTSMNSWWSSGLSAWAPPLTTFIMGTGSETAPVPPR